MSTLATCIRKAGKSMNPVDVQEITTLRDEYLKDGVDGQQASLNAIRDVIGLITDERNKVLKKISKAGGAVPGDPRIQFSQTGWHGSPHQFKKFSLAAIGTGEGNQAYGWGMYFGGKREVGEFYRNSTSKWILNTEKGTMNAGDIVDALIDGIQHPSSLNSAFRSAANETITRITNGTETYQEAADRIRSSKYARMYKGLPEAIESLRPNADSGNLYQVSIPENNELLDWDKPLSEQNNIDVQDILDELVNSESDYHKASALSRKYETYSNKNTGEDLYQLLTQEKGSDQKASEYLNGLGIKGLRYLDGTSRSKGEGHHNYVIWDESVVNVESINGDKVQFSQKPKLDMSKAARMKRAKEMGFDVDTVWYHGTDADSSNITKGFDTKDRNLDPALMANPRGDNIGTFFSQTRADATDFGKNIHRVYLRMTNPKTFNTQQEWRDFNKLHSKVVPEVRDNEGYIIEDEKFEHNTRKVLENQGYDGVIIKTPNYTRGRGKPWAIVFDPKNIRSVNAAFDPNESSSSNLLFSQKPKLDMSKAARMKRAEEMGFDVDTVYYHGSDSNFNEFRTGRETKRYTTFTEETVTTQGVFVSPSEKDAAIYGDNVMALYIKPGRVLENPTMITASSKMSDTERNASKKAWDDIEYILEPVMYEITDGVMVIDTNGGVSNVEVDGDGTWLNAAMPEGFIDWNYLDNPKVVARMKERGYDSVKVNELNDESGESFFIIDPKNIRSVNAAFDPNESGSSNLLFSQKPGDSINLGNMVNTVRESSGNLASSIKNGDIVAGNMDKVLATIPMRYLKDFAPPKMVDSVNEFSDLFSQLEARANELQEEYAPKINEVRDYVAHNPEAEATVDLMYESTLAGVDPSKNFTDLTYPNVDNRQITLSSEMAFRAAERGYKDRLAKLERDAKRAARDGGNVKETMAYQNVKSSLNGLYKRWKQQKNRKAEYPAIKRQWDALSPESQDIYKKTRDIYKALRDQEDEALAKRLTDLAENSDSGMTKQLDRVRVEFENNTVEEPYFKLFRTGKFWVASYNAAGETDAFWRFETLAERREKIAELKDNGIPYRSGKRFEQADIREIDPTFAASVVEKIQGLGSSEAIALADTVWQQHLDRLPEMSIRKQQMHRKKRKGFEKDIMRALSHSAFHGSNQIAKLEFSGLMDRTLEEIGLQAKNTQFDDDKTDIATDLHVELEKRLKWIRNPSTSTLATRATQLGFFMYLGVTPAAALVNMSQTAIVAFPVLGAEFGMGKSMNAILRAGKDAFRRGGIEKQLSGDELDAFHAFHRRGLLTKTQSHDLAGISQEGVDYDSSWNKVMELVATPFHRAEVWNREATAMAAYRLARDKGLTHDEAVSKASELTWTSHFDYCVDADTEILTKMGWKKYDELTRGELVMSMDNSGQCVESELKEINVFTGKKQVTEFSHTYHRFSMMVTPNHESVIQNYNSRDKKWQNIRKVKTYDLKNSHHILRVPLKPLKRSKSLYGVDLAALLGWIAAEGQYSKFRNCKHKSDVRLVQSAHHNPKYVKEIADILSRLGNQCKRFDTRKGEMIVWTINGELRKRVLKEMPDKILTYEMFSKMNPEEMSAVCEGFSKGDGHLRKSGGWTIGQKNNKNVRNLEVIQAMLTVLGTTSTLSEKSTNDCKNLITCGTGHKQTKRTIVKTLNREDKVVSMVWCPTTEHGTWIARRKGAVFVTGNSNSNRPRFMQNDVAKVIFLFKQYSLNMTYRLVRDFHDMRKGMTPEQRREAGKRFAGILGMTSLFAGAAGMPLFTVTTAIANMLVGDEDDPYDMEVAMRSSLAELFGQTGSQIIMDGVVNAATGMDIASRVSLDNLWLRDPLYDLEGRSLWQHYTGEMLGPVFKLGESYAEGSKLIGQENYQRGIELMLPKFGRDVVRGLRFYEEGAINLKGDPILDQSEFSGLELTAQTLGFVPSQLSLQYKQNNAIKKAESRIRNRRSQLLNRYALALRFDDPGDLREAINDIKDFNEANSRYPITNRTIKQSMKTRARHSRESFSGITLDKNLRYLVDDLQFVD